MSFGVGIFCVLYGRNEYTLDHAHIVAKVERTEVCCSHLTLHRAEKGVQLSGLRERGYVPALQSL
jgi:hypothetical protein